MHHPNTASKNIHIELRNTEFLETVPLEATRVEITLSPSTRALGTLSIPLSFHKKDTFLSKQSIIVKTTATQLFIRSKTPLKKGTLIKRENVEEKMENIRGNPTNAFHKIEDVIEKELTVSIPNQAILTHWNTQPVPKVRSGDLVILILKNNAVKLKIKGKALSDGHIGDIINVESQLKTRKYLKGEIVDSQHVKIQTINF